MGEFDNYLKPPNIWFQELHKNEIGLTIKIKDVLYSEYSKYQRIMVFDTYEVGKILVLYSAIMLSEKDEFFYHEMISHVPLFAHPHPEDVLIIGGGDGGTLREVCKHKVVKRVDLVEIDPEVVKVSKKFFPTLSGGFYDPRSNIIFGDGFEFVKNTSNKYDVIIVDSPDPIGPAESIFGRNFYENLKNVMKEGAIVVTQSESPFYHLDFIKNMAGMFKSIFKNTYLYLTWVPMYPSGMWSFLFASDSTDNSVKRDIPADMERKLKFYNKEVHEASFKLPNFVKSALNGKS